MRLKVVSVFFGLICVSTFSFAQNSDVIDCPKGSYGIAINSPNSGKAKTGDSLGVIAEQTKKSDYLNCKLSEFNPILTNTFVLGTVSKTIAFTTATFAALNQKQPTPKELNLRAKAVYFFQLNKDNKNLINIAESYRNMQCQRNFSPNRPEVPTYIPARKYDLALSNPNIDEISSAWKALDRFSTAELKISCSEAIRNFIQAASR